MGVLGITLPINNWIAGAANPNKFMLSGGDFGDGWVYTSTDGKTGWAQAVEIGFPGVLDACGWDNNFVIVGQGGATWAAATYTDDNWATFGSGDLDINAFWEGCNCKTDGSVVVAVGALAGEGVSARSTDGGATWSSPANSFGTGVFPSKVGWTGTVFLAVTYSGEIFSSSDGLTWTLETTLTGSQIYDVISRGGVAVAVGYDGSGPGVWHSEDDGATWAAATPPAGYSNSIFRVAANDNFFMVIEDNTSDYSLSADGVTWSAPAAAPSNGGGAVFNDGAEASRGDRCLQATKSFDYALIVEEDAVAAAASAWFHFSF